MIRGMGDTAIKNALSLPYYLKAKYWLIYTFIILARTAYSALELTKGDLPPYTLLNYL